jgi:hypothetical protein
MPPQGGIFLSIVLAKANKLAYDSDMRIPLLLLLVLPFSLQADIYRSVDSNGNVSYTDEPNNQAELIELEELPTYEATPIPVLPVEATPAPVEEDEPLKKPKYKISIMSPEQNQSIWTGGGVLTVSVSVQPELNANRADKVQFKLDGKKAGEPQTALSYTFESIERGSHILTVSVVDKKGNVIKTSKSVLFHMHRNSVAQNGEAAVSLATSSNKISFD